MAIFKRKETPAGSEVFSLVDVLQEELAELRPAAFGTNTPPRVGPLGRSAQASTFFDVGAFDGRALPGNGAPPRETLRERLAKGAVRMGTSLVLCRLRG
jgi:hypothetical protein